MRFPSSRFALALLCLSTLSRSALAEDALEEEAEYVDTEDAPQLYFDARYVRATVVGGTPLSGGSPANGGTRIAADRIMNSNETGISLKNAYRYTGNRLEHSWTSAPDAWSTADLGGCFTSSAASVSWGPGRTDLFARGCDNAFYHLWNDGSGWKPGWGNWEFQGGYFISGPSVASYAHNSLQVVGVGSDRAVWLKTWNGSAWSGWVSLGGLA